MKLKHKFCDAQAFAVMFEIVDGKWDSATHQQIADAVFPHLADGNVAVGQQDLEDKRIPVPVMFTFKPQLVPLMPPSVLPKVRDLIDWFKLDLGWEPAKSFDCPLLEQDYFEGLKRARWPTL